MYIDIHRHSSDEGKADLVLRNLFHSQSEEISQRRYFSVGLHPWHVKAESLEEDIESVRQMAVSKQVLAVGEAGLDRSIQTSLDIQLKAFKMQMEIAQDANKAIVIHCVKSYSEFQKIRKESKAKRPWIFHWFNAHEQTARDLVRRGCYLSFGHLLFVERSQAFKSFLKIPLENVFLETDDAQYDIEEVYIKAAKAKGVSLEALQQQMKKNFETCFELEL